MARKRLKGDVVEQNGHQNGDGQILKVAPEVTSGQGTKVKLMVWSTAMCCINMIFQEQLLRKHTKCGNFISLSQHVFISLVGLYKVGGLPFGLLGSPKPALSVWLYWPLFLLNLLSVLTNNFSINFGVSIPLNMIFKSSSLISNLFLGMLIMKHRYSLGKYLSVFLITSGLILCTIEDYRLKNADSPLSTPSSFLSSLSLSSLSLPSLSSLLNTEQLFTQTLGILFLIASLLLSSGTGIYQEYLKSNHGKHAEESLLYAHLLALPLIALTCLSEPDTYWKGILYGDWWSVLCLLAIVLSQYLCIQSVYKLSSECPSLTVTLCVTNRKFLSLIFSIFYFGNAFTAVHWAGTLVVFGATILFISVDRKPKVA